MELEVEEVEVGSSGCAEGDADDADAGFDAAGGSIVPLLLRRRSPSSSRCSSSPPPGGGEAMVSRGFFKL
jgi:hypothetical protein